MIKRIIKGVFGLLLFLASLFMSVTYVYLVITKEMNSDVSFAIVGGLGIAIGFDLLRTSIKKGE